MARPTDSGAKTPERRSLVYRWDLDKTYLRTEFDTVRDLFRTALESAGQKRTVAGAAPLLRELRATDPRAIHIISGSPDHMRGVLEAKLRLDGIRWDRFTLKPQLKSLLAGRFRQLKDQVGYKLGVLLDSRGDLGADGDEYLFGDDAEADAFIYSLYGDLCAGRVELEVLVGVLQAAGVYDNVVPRLVRLARDVPRSPGRARRVFIHLDRLSNPGVFADFGRRVCPFYNYAQPTYVLLDDGALPPLAALRVAAELIIHHGFTPEALAASYRDLVGRRHLGGGAARALRAAIRKLDERHFATTAPVLRTFAELLGPLEDTSDAPSPGPIEIDYPSLFRRDRVRAKLAKARLTVPPRSYRRLVRRLDAPPRQR